MAWHHLSWYGKLFMVVGFATVWVVGLTIFLVLCFRVKRWIGRIQFGLQLVKEHDVMTARIQAAKDNIDRTIQERREDTA